MSKTAVITGASGQDAFYLANFLLARGYRVIGTERRVARPQSDTVELVSRSPKYELVEGDVTDFSSIGRVVAKYMPDEFYHLAAQSEVGTSFNQPLTTLDITGMGTVNCLEVLRTHKPDTKFYFAGSSEQFGDTHNHASLNEKSLMLPRSPYAAAKLLGYHMAKLYRESYDMFACCGLLFNHESPHRKPYFVTRKITIGVAKIAAGEADYIELGNIKSGRDWGHAKDYMRAAYMMMQNETPDDYVIATGKFHTIEELLTAAFSAVDIDDWSNYIRINAKYLRPNDVVRLVGDSSKARDALGWQPEYTFEQMIAEMVKHDLTRIHTV